HPHLNVTTVCGHSSVGETLGRHQPHLPRFSELVVQESTAEVLVGHDVVVLALPHGQSGAISAELEKTSPDTLIVDLAADHRLISATAWEKFYGSDHQGTWTYGLPELLTADGTKQREALTDTKRIAVPGCNVTAVTLGLAPLTRPRRARGPQCRARQRGLRSRQSTETASDRGRSPRRRLALRHGWDPPACARDRTEPQRRPRRRRGRRADADLLHPDARAHGPRN